MDAMEFFENSAGKWKSQRTTHHLPFRRAETGSSDIFVQTLPADGDKVVEICQIHEVDAKLTVGGAFVSWDGSMAWDKDNENHQGSTVFALIPNPETSRCGKLLRERGYAEIVPIAGNYEMDDENALVLITEYDTMSTIERFWFATENIRLRISTVQRFGGFNTSTFCVESRILESSQKEETQDSNQKQVLEKELGLAISGW